MIIKEFLPNPVGKDADGEYIKIFNDGNSAVNLSGWAVKDASEKIFNLNGSLDGGKELLLPYSQTKIFLNNSGEQIFLYDNYGKLADELSYSGQAEEGQIIIKQLAVSESAAEESGIINKQGIAPQTIFIGFFAAVILAGFSLYIILQLEKKLEIKLF